MMCDNANTREADYDYQEASIYMMMFQDACKNFEENSKRHNQIFMSTYKVDDEKDPIVLKFNAFVMGVDLAGEAYTLQRFLNRRKLNQCKNIDDSNTDQATDENINIDQAVHK